MCEISLTDWISTIVLIVIQNIFIKYSGVTSHHTSLGAELSRAAVLCASPANFLSDNESF